MEPQLTIQIVGWNSAEVLGAGLAVLENTPPDAVIIRYLDNASQDGSVELVRQLLPNAVIVELPRNVGFARAHNIGLSQCTTPFVLLHDPDVALNWQGVVSLLNRLQDPSVAAVQGKLLRTAQRGTRPVIDSTGIVLSVALNGIERDAGEVDFNQRRQETPLLAVTAACGLYRLDALRHIAYSPTEFLDNDFFSYKEDVDVGWRLNNAGWQVLYLPLNMGYHQRTLGRQGMFGWGLNPIRIYRRLRNPRTRYSLRNWIWMIAKNASLGQLVLHLPAVVIRACVVTVLSTVYPPLLKVWFEIIVGLPACIRKRYTRLPRRLP